MSQSLIKKLQLGIVSLSALALMAACGDSNTTQEPADTNEPAVEEPNQSEETDDKNETEKPAADDAGTLDTSKGLSNVEFPVSVEQALQKFYDTFGENINIDQIELETDRNIFKYSISGWDEQNEYELDVDAETGEVVKQEKEQDNDRDDEILNMDNIITPQEAMDIAIKDTGSENIESWKLEVDDGITVYEIDFEDSAYDDITINAETGAIVDR